MSMYDDSPDECLKCVGTIEDLSNKLYVLEVFIEELEENHSDEVEYLHGQIEMLEKVISKLRRGEIS